MKEKFSSDGVNIHDVGEEAFSALEALRADLVQLRPQIEEITGLYGILEATLEGDHAEINLQAVNKMRQRITDLTAQVDAAALAVVERCKSLDLCDTFLTCFPDGGAVVYDLDPSVAGWQSVEFFPWFDLPGWTEPATAKTPRRGLA